MHQVRYGIIQLTSGLVVRATNYLQIFTYDSWKNKWIPPYAEQQRILPTCSIKQGTTTAPSLLTEADLVSLMDKNGIGTDATIAEHIRKVIDRQYVMTEKQGKISYLVPSTLGMGLVEGYAQMEFSKRLCHPVLRRDTEAKLGLVAAASVTKDTTISEFMEEYARIFAVVQRDFGTIKQVGGMEHLFDTDDSKIPPNRTWVWKPVADGEHGPFREFTA